MTKRQTTTTNEKKTRGKYSKSACQACRKAHVKCILSSKGGRPCERCTKKGINCIEQVARRSRRERRSTAKVENFAQTELKSFSATLAAAVASSTSGSTLSSLLAGEQNAFLEIPTISPTTSAHSDIAKMLTDPDHLSTFNPELYPTFDSMHLDTQERLTTLYAIVSQQQTLLSQSMSELTQLKHSTSHHHSESVSRPVRAMEADFARCFSSPHLPVLVLDRSRSLSFFSSNPDMYTEGSIFCNQAFGQMLQVDITKFTSPNFSHQNIGTWAWNRVMSTNQVIKEVSKLIFDNDVEYVQFKSLLQDAHGHHFFVNAKLHIYAHFSWIIFEPAAFIDDELQINEHVHHSTKKFRDINQWRDWVTQPNSLVHLLKWVRDLFAAPVPNGLGGTGMQNGASMPQGIFPLLSSSTPSSTVRPTSTMSTTPLASNQQHVFGALPPTTQQPRINSSSTTTTTDMPPHHISAVITPQSARTPFPPQGLAVSTHEEHSRSRDAHLPAHHLTHQVPGAAATDHIAAALRGNNSASSLNALAHLMSGTRHHQNGAIGGTNPPGMGPNVIVQHVLQLGRNIGNTRSGAPQNAAETHFLAVPGVIGGNGQSSLSTASDSTDLIHSGEEDDSEDGLGSESRSSGSSESFSYMLNDGGLLEDGDLL